MNKALSSNRINLARFALINYIQPKTAMKGDEIVRKYSLANGSMRGSVDLRDYSDVITAAVQEYAPGATVVVCKDYYTVLEPLTQSQAVKIGRRICESDLSQYCIKLSKLFSSKEVTNEEPKQSKRPGGYH